MCFVYLLQAGERNFFTSFPHNLGSTFSRFPVVVPADLCNMRFDALGLRESLDNEADPPRRVLHNISRPSRHFSNGFTMCQPTDGRAICHSSEPPSLQITMKKGTEGKGGNANSAISIPLVPFALLGPFFSCGEASVPKCPTGVPSASTRCRMPWTEVLSLTNHWDDRFNQEALVNFHNLAVLVGAVQSFFWTSIHAVLRLMLEQIFLSDEVTAVHVALHRPSVYQSSSPGRM